MRQVLGLILAAAAFVSAPPGTGHSDRTSPLEVISNGRAPAAERSAGKFAQRLLSHLRVSRDNFQAFSSIGRITALGTSRPDDDHTVVGLRGIGQRGAQATTLYTVVVLRHDVTGYTPVDAIFTCDPEGQGVAFPVTLERRSLVVALGAGDQAGAIDAIAVQAGAPMQAWNTSSVDSISSPVLLRSGRTDELCRG
jgi:hypothetical protein